MACAAGDAVTDGTMLLWKGFVSLIASAYFENRMAWYPVVRPFLTVTARSLLTYHGPCMHHVAFAINICQPCS